MHSQDLRYKTSIDSQKEDVDATFGEESVLIHKHCPVK